jgi:hypothetical protein
MQNMEGTADESYSYCFIDATALFGAGVLTLEQYLFHLLEHFKGVRHQLDTLKGDVLSRTDPFAASLRALIFDTEAVDGKTKSSEDSL